MGSINKAQQAYYAENGEFTASIDALGVGIKTQTNNYKYDCDNLAPNSVVCVAESPNPALRNYAGGVFIDPTANLLTTILCETTSPSQTSYIGLGQTDCFQGNMSGI